MHENLCLQLEVDSMSVELDKLKRKLSRSDTQNSLKYVNSKTKSISSEKIKEKKVVRIDSNTTVIKHDSKNVASASIPDVVTKIYERKQTPDVPTIREILPENSSVYSTPAEKSSTSQTSKSTKESIMALMQVSSNGSVTFGSESGTEPVRIQSAPEIVQSSVFNSDTSCKSCESVQVGIKYYKYGNFNCAK